MVSVVTYKESDNMMDTLEINPLFSLCNIMQNRVTFFFRKLKKNKASDHTGASVDHLASASGEAQTQVTQLEGPDAAAGTNLVAHASSPAGPVTLSMEAHASEGNNMARLLQSHSPESSATSNSNLDNQLSTATNTAIPSVGAYGPWAYTTGLNPVHFFI